MPASLIAAGDALARFFAAPEIGSVPHRSARQGILILVDNKLSFILFP